jgi:hypothetical protein
MKFATSKINSSDDMGMILSLLISDKYENYDRVKVLQEGIASGKTLTLSGTV